MGKNIKIFLACTGVILIILGIVCVCNPVETLFAGAWLLGILTLLSGISEMVFTLNSQKYIPNSGTRMLSALLQIFIGIFFLAHKGAVTVSLLVIFAIWIIIQGVSLAIESVDYKKVGYKAWWVICLLGVAAAVFGFLSLKNPLLAGKTLSILIGLGVISNGISYLIACAGINKFGKRVAEFRKNLVDEQ